MHMSNVHIPVILSHLSDFLNSLTNVARNFDIKSTRSWKLSVMNQLRAAFDIYDFAYCSRYGTGKLFIPAKASTVFIQSSASQLDSWPVNSETVLFRSGNSR